MNLLRSIDRSEIVETGGVEALYSSLLKAVNRPGQQTLWAVPWRSCMVVLYYRRDLLAAAGIPQEKAFDRFEDMGFTLQQLQEVGIEYPWVLATNPSRIGRPHPQYTLWTRVEHEIDLASEQMMAALYSNPEADISELLEEYFAPVAKRIDLTMTFL